MPFYNSSVIIYVAEENNNQEKGSLSHTSLR
jgi:hypothetical protein